MIVEVNGMNEVQKEEDLTQETVAAIKFSVSCDKAEQLWILLQWAEERRAERAEVEEMQEKAVKHILRQETNIFEDFKS